jgi:phosphopantothenoylcysteine decarboxylase/phosphopantothenate--cysteine ligase
MTNSFPPGREIVLGIGGGIAAYKVGDLLRRLKDHGFLVTVIPTQASLNFVGKATWEALSGRAVEDQLWNNVHKVPHIDAAKKADLILIAPTTADLLARIVSGRADDYLTNVVLASKAPLMLVPAMHPEMWLNPATVHNIKVARERGITVLDPDIGRLTGTDSGPGRFPDTARILDVVTELLLANSDLLGKSILVTAGGTREPIDAVRYLGNRSSGKQGRALALAAAKRGAVVQLISANIELPDIEGITTIKVQTAAEMFKAAANALPGVDVVIMSAAVADVRPASTIVGKIAKSDLESIELTENLDILKFLTSNKRLGQIFVGFAAETDSDIKALKAKGARKLLEKNLDIVYVNDVSDGAIFGSDKTSGWILNRDGSELEIVDQSKDSLANAVLDLLVHKLSLSND